MKAFEFSRSNSTSTYLPSSFFLVLFLASHVTAQTTEVRCIFVRVDGIYTCSLISRNIVDDESQNFVVTGLHFGGNTDASVRAVEIEASSSVPFVIPKLFETFPNVFRFIVSPSGLTRIQANAFRFARNLELIVINSNPLQTIQPNAFIGAENLRSLDLSRNQIVNIFDESFTGLASLRDLMLESNRIQRIPRNLLRPLENLEAIHLAENRIATIDGKLFSGLQRLREIDLVGNRINEIGKNVLDGLYHLEIFNIFRNRCVNDFWIIDDSTSIDTIRNGLDACFVNFDALKFMQVEVRGKVTISDDYDNEIISW
jgi:hypothetical protein